MLIRNTLKTFKRSTPLGFNKIHTGALTGLVNSNGLVKKTSSSADLFKQFSKLFRGQSRSYVSNDPLTLPPPADPTKKTLVLDLDEVLITSVSEREAQANNIPTHKSLETTQTKRPGIDDFLLEMSKHFEIVLLTFSVQEYADINLQHLPDVFEHRRYRHDMKQTKKVSLMGREMDKIILIDDHFGYLHSNPDNQIVMPDNQLS